MSDTMAHRIMKSSPSIMTVAEALYVLRSTGHDISTHDGADGTVSVYADGQHAFDYEENRPTVATSHVRSTLNDLDAQDCQGCGDRSTPVTVDGRPYCSQSCADVLAAWLNPAEF